MTLTNSCVKLRLLLLPGLVGFLTILSCYAVGQKKTTSATRSAPTAAAPAQKLYTCMLNVGPGLKNEISSDKVENCDIFYTHEIASGPGIMVDTILFKKTLAAKIPNRKAKGIAIIDWEGKADSALRSGVIHSTAFNKALQQFTLLINLARRERPGVQWGLYNIPFTSIWWQTDSSYLERNRQLLPMTTLFDIWVPCFYDYYPDKTVKWARDLEFYQHETIYMLRVAEPYGIRILPAVWHRYHDSEPVNGMTLIDREEFSRSVKAMLAASYNGQKSMGVMWWQEDLYFFRIKDMRVVKNFGAMEESKFLDTELLPYFHDLQQVFQDNKN